MITGKENYTRAIECTGPEYLPSLLSVMLDWLWETDPAKQARIRELHAAGPDDFLGAGECYRDRFRPPGQTRWQDEWGVRWEYHDSGARVVGGPLTEGYHLLDGLALPDPLEPARFDAADAKLAQRGGRYTRGNVWMCLFERMWMFRGFDEMLMDPYLDQANFLRLRDLLVEINLGFIDQWLARGIDGIFFSDDWGTQRTLLMNPDDWRRLYRPAYERMFRRVRDGGAHVWLHSCGNVKAIIPDLIDVGLSVLNPVQPLAMDIGELAREFGGKVCFYGAIDTQGELITGSPAEVKDHVRHTVDTLGAFNGGYIGAQSQTIMPETPLDNVIAAYEALAEYR